MLLPLQAIVAVIILSCGKNRYFVWLLLLSLWVLIAFASSALPQTYEIVQRGSDILGTHRSEFAGYSVSISSDGDIVAVGSHGFDTSAGDEGRVRVFACIGSSWSQRGSDILGTQINEQAGYSISLSSDGSAVAIGSPYFDTFITDTGRVRVFAYNDGSWSQRGSDISGTQASEYSGRSVSLSSDGSVVAIGSTFFDTHSSYTTFPSPYVDRGRVRVFKYSGSSWLQHGPDILGTQTYEQAGNSVSLSSDGSVVAIGSIHGNLRVFAYIASTWSQRGSFSSIVGSYPVAISGDGLTLILMNKVFYWDGSSWSQRGSDIAEDTSFSAVAINSDGANVVVGDYAFNSYNGKVRVFDISSLTQTPPTTAVLSSTGIGNNVWIVLAAVFGVLFILVFCLIAVVYYRLSAILNRHSRKIFVEDSTEYAISNCKHVSNGLEDEVEVDI